MITGKLYIFLVLAVAIFNTIRVTEAATPGSAFFRKDYTFVPEADGFYKLHRILNTFWDAKKRCSMEGGTLWIPENEEEVKAVTAMWKKKNPGISNVYIGITDLVSEGFFLSIDGRSIDNLYNGWGENEPYDDGDEDCILISLEGEMNDVNCSGSHNFMCKKSFASLEWNIFCDIPDLKYEFKREIGKCYKLHQNPKSWTDAFSVCDAEQSYLAIINNQKEADLLKKFYADAPKQNYRGKINRDVIHLGFRYDGGNEWQTIKGVRIEESGYTKWADNQPDDYYKDINCGGMSPSGELHDVNCEDLCSFICEHDITALNLSFDERYGSMSTNST